MGLRGSQGLGVEGGLDEAEQNAGSLAMQSWIRIR